MTTHILTVETDEQYYKNLKRKRIIGRAAKILILAVLCLWAFVAVYPFVWTFLASFKPRAHVVSKPLELPFNEFFTLENYQKIFQGSLNIWRAYINSFYISGLVTAGTVFCAYLMAFVMARFNFKFKFIIEGLIVSCMMFPAFSLLFPIIRILAALNLFGDQLGVVFPQIALNLGFTTILMTGFLKSMPREIEEAAYIDGAGIVRILFAIVLPMAKSAVVTAAIFVFIWSYNDLFLQMIIIVSEQKFPISLLLNRLASRETGFDYGKMAAAVTMISFPIILVYVILQKHIIKGLMAGAIKG